MRIILSYIILFSSVFALGQDLAAFMDQRNYFHVVANGHDQVVEVTKVNSYQVGGKYVAYLNSDLMFKVFDNGTSKTVSFGNNVNYQVTDNFVVFMTNKTLKVFDNGKTVLLSGWADSYTVGDSMVVFKDHIKEATMIYYKGEIIPLLNVASSYSMGVLKVKDNMLAYSLQATSFHVFYNGKKEEILGNAIPESFDVGRNTVAYVDPNTNSFDVFNKGEYYQIDEFPPIEYEVGDDLVAYVDNLGTFNVFYNGEVTELTNIAPPFYEVEDGIVVYNDQGVFKAFWHGEIHLLESFIPKSYQLDNNQVIFPNALDFVKLFDRGNLSTITNERVNSYQLSYDTVVLNVGYNKFKVYHKGEFIN